MSLRLLLLDNLYCLSECLLRTPVLKLLLLNCTSPQICAYDVWDGSKAFKYSGMDFTSGQIVLNPGDAREFNILFGPNIGYGGTEFEFDSSKDYVFRISKTLVQVFL